MLTKPHLSKWTIVSLKIKIIHLNMNLNFITSQNLIHLPNIIHHIFLFWVIIVECSFVWFIQRKKIKFLNWKFHKIQKITYVWLYDLLNIILNVRWWIQMTINIWRFRWSCKLKPLLNVTMISSNLKHNILCFKISNTTLFRHFNLL